MVFRSYFHFTPLSESTFMTFISILCIPKFSSLIFQPSEVSAQSNIAPTYAPIIQLNHLLTYPLSTFVRNSTLANGFAAESSPL